jgi:hypothetical protein
MKPIFEGLPAPENWVEKRFVEPGPLPGIEEATKPYFQDWSHIMKPMKPTIFEEATDLPLLGFEEANERVVTLTVALRRLLEQIQKGNLVDDHGHDFRMNKAYCEALELVKTWRLICGGLNEG